MQSAESERERSNNSSNNSSNNLDDELTSLGVTMERVVWGRTFAIDGATQLCSLPLDLLEKAVATESVDTFASRLHAAPNLHALWAVINASTDGVVKKSSDFDDLWKDSSAQRRFASYFNAATNQTVDGFFAARGNAAADPAALLTEITRDSVAAELLWIVVGSTGAGKTELVDCMRRIAQPQAQGMIRAAAGGPKGLERSATTTTSRMWGIDMKANRVWAGDTRGWIDDTLKERVLSTVGIANAIANYGFDGTTQTAGASKKAAVAVVCVDASAEFAPLWLYSMRVDDKGIHVLDESGTKPPPLTDRDAWKGLVAVAGVLEKAGIKVYVLFTHADQIGGPDASSIDKCAKMAAIFNACPMGVQAKDFVILPDHANQVDTAPCAYTRKKVVYIMLRLMRLSVQCSDLLADAKAAKNVSKQPTSANTADVHRRVQLIAAPHSAAPASAPGTQPAPAPAQPGLSRCQWCIAALCIALAFGIAFAQIADLHSEMRASLALLQSMDAKLARNVA
jgi:energy-coupling factor transporter ATP-binding protein EcfA2